MSTQFETTTDAFPTQPEENTAGTAELIRRAQALQPGEIVRLRKVTWDDYEALLTAFESHSIPRFTYDKGILQIMSPRPDHEQPNRMLDDLVTILCDELEIDVLNCGSTTLQQKSSAAGVEPDTCFYLKNESKVRGKETIDLAVDPAPDLVIEIDVTNGSMDKFPIYAAMKVPEIWLYTKQEILFHHRKGTRYVPRTVSGHFPFLRTSDVEIFLLNCKDRGQRQARQLFRQWVGQQKKPSLV